MWSIRDANGSDIVYYNYYEEEYDAGKASFNLYNYRTEEVVLLADAKAKEKAEEIGRANLEKIQKGLKEKQDQEQSKVITAEIYNVYKANQLVANEWLKPVFSISIK